MKKIFMMLSMLMMINIALAAEKTVSLDVPTMTCPVCPFTVEKALNGVDGVTAVDVSFEEKMAKVTFDDKKTTAEALTEATKNAGYPSIVKN
jgi:mercuric ion binding protein